MADATTSLGQNIISSLGSLSGTGSGGSLNINSIVSALVSADRAPEDARISRQLTGDNTEISALGQLQSALSAFQSAAQSMNTASALNPHTATSSSLTTYTASADSTAAAGSYTVQVLALAQAHQLASAAFAGGSTAVVGTGTLTIAVGSQSFNVTINSSNNTVSGIAGAINTATGNTGVQATVLTDSNGAHLVLTSTQTGAANTINVTQSGTLSQLVYDSVSNVHNLTQLQAAQNAHIQIDGYDYYNATNTVSGALTGVTLNLLSAVPGTNTTLTVAKDTSTLTSKVSSFVAAYNQLQSVIASLDSYNASTRAAGPLLGDVTLSGIETKLRQDLSNTVSGLSGTYTSLASIGITKQADGTLSLNQTKLSAALAANANAVSQVFASTNGVANQLNTDLTAMLSSTGALSSRTQQLQRDLARLQTQAAALNERMTQVQTNYTQQFTALETLLAKLQTQSTYLTQQFTQYQKTNGA